MEEKTRKTAKWEGEFSIYSVVLPAGAHSSFDLEEAFPTFPELNEVQKFIIRYGVKQFLSDKTARTEGEKLTEIEKIMVMESRWNDLLAGKFRLNATGGAEKISVSKASKNLDDMTDEDLAEMGMTRENAKLFFDRIMKK